MVEAPKKSIMLEEFKPKSKLVTRQTRVMVPRFPVVDAHDHLGPEFGGDWLHRPIGELLAVLDEANVRTYVDLDGGWGEEILNTHLDFFKSAAPERFKVFGGVDWSAWQAKGDHFGEWAASRFRAQAARGADGLKIWKPLGLSVRDQHQALVSVDDPRLDPIWAAAGELHLPVTIHIADPVAFFEPLNATNERWEELSFRPDWHFQSPPYPAFISILNALAAVVKRHPQTTFIGAHVGCYAENLDWVGAMLDHCPNFNVDISARIGELGRQPYTARKFFVQYADRILFGTDAGPNLDEYRTYFRFLETDDEYFNYGRSEIPPQGRWAIYGLYLPVDVLAKVYYQNAARLLGIQSINPI
ncbi:MAG TPA: amidohydrolase family protein [Anaerolineaceae bacterium]|jgi:predicted TIM-barrel fold metal-dependent hydrolase